MPLRKAIPSILPKSDTPPANQVTLMARTLKCGLNPVKISRKVLIHYCEPNNPTLSVRNAPEKSNTINITQIRHHACNSSHSDGQDFKMRLKPCQNSSKSLEFTTVSPIIPPYQSEMPLRKAIPSISPKSDTLPANQVTLMARTLKCG